MRNLYDDARHSDALFPGPNGLPFYQRLIAAGGSHVLGLACGTGRLTVPLAATGADITGVDQSPSMLEAALNRAARDQVTVLFQEGDMRDYDLGREFRLIFVSTSSFSHLQEHEESESCLRCTRKHLAPGGSFVIDIATEVNHSIWRYTNKDTQKSGEISFSLRMLYTQEITNENKFGWYDGSPYTDASPEQLIVSR
jgi:SAM-dependent methyltransferase